MEDGSTLIETLNGGRMEVLGGLTYTVGGVDDSPRFLVDSPETSISFPEICFTGRPFTTIVSEIRGDALKDLRHADLRWGRHFSLYGTTRPVCAIERLRE